MIAWFPLFIVWAMALFSGGALAEPPTTKGGSEPFRYALVLTGSELLEGIYADAHTQFITRSLKPLGGRCVVAVAVGDRRSELLESLRFARSQAPLVMVTGGLGPTDADLTRQVLAEYTGIPLLENPDLLRGLERRFGRPAPELSPGVRRQSLVPGRGGYLPNPEGTAAGLIFEAGEVLILALPGPPNELQAMVTAEVIPLLTRRFALRPPGSAAHFRFVGIGESAVSQILHERLELPDDVVHSFQFEAGRVDLTLALPGSGTEDALRLSRLRDGVIEHLGEFVYAEDETTLEACVLGWLERRGLTLALAEVGSAGAVTQALLEAAGESRRVAGSLVAADHHGMAILLKGRGAESGIPGDVPASADSAASAAAQVRQVLGARWGLAVSAPAAGEGGGLFVWVAAGAPEVGFAQRRLVWRGGSRTGKSRMVTEILDFLRRELQSRQVSGG